MIIVGIGIVAVYVYYLKEKNEYLKIIQTGICPKCHQKSIYISDTRGGGCGPKIVSFRCTNCGYEDSFSMEGSCGI